MLTSDYREMLSALLDAKVDFIVVGAFALAAHGHPRATGGIDIYVRPTDTNSRRVLVALKESGAPTDHIDEGDFLITTTVFQIGASPCRIDLMTGLDGVEDFDEAWKSHIRTTVEGISIPVLGRDVLIKNKRAVGRPQDLADVACLEANPE